MTRALEKEGMQVHYEDDPDRIPPQVNLAVWTPALPNDHKELTHFRNSDVPLMKRAEVLGVISKNRRCVAVAGTHGKTSTSSLITHLLHDGGIDPSAFLGGLALNFDSNFIDGKSDWVVAEADEYDRSFMHLHPEITVINSMDPDHLDIYGSHEAMLETYRKFMLQIKPGGVLMYKAGLPVGAVPEELRKTDRKVCSFGLDTGDLCASQPRIEGGMQVFNVSTGPNWPGEQLSDLELRIPFPGKYNVENATAATGAALLTGVEPAKIVNAMEVYRGVHRRFEYIIREDWLAFIDDYAHHPEELRAAIAAVRSLYPGKKLTGVFQPHLFTRTRDFASGFAEALDGLDQCILLPIYPARELPIEGVKTEIILERMQLSDKVLVEMDQLVDHIAANPPEVLITLGAGDIDTLVQPLKQRLLNKRTEN